MARMYEWTNTRMRMDERGISRMNGRVDDARGENGEVDDGGG